VIGADRLRAQALGGPSRCYAASVTAADIPAPAADGVIDLLGLLAYGSLTAFFRMSEDAALAESIDDKAALAGLAVAEFGHFQLARARIERSAADPATAMQPFMAAVDAFHARTEPADWLEGLVKAYVGAGVAADFYGEAYNEAIRERLGTPSSTALYIESEDLAGFHSRLKAGGVVRIIDPLASRPWGQEEFTVEDPAGNWLSRHSTWQEHAAPVP
jgi:hypothetical protein